MIVLKCANASGSAAFGAERIEGIPTPARRYVIVDGETVLDGYSESVLHHDMMELLSIPGGLYRPMTPSEQNARAKARQDAATVEEVAPVVEEKPAPKKVAG